MFDPRAQDPKDLTDSEVEEKVRELTSKYSIAARFPDQSVLPQIATLLSMYREELSKRQRASLQKATDDNKNTDLDDLINVD